MLLTPLGETKEISIFSEVPLVWTLRFRRFQATDEIFSQNIC